MPLVLLSVIPFMSVYIYFMYLATPMLVAWGLPGGTLVKNMPANVGDTGDSDLIPGLGRCSGVGNVNLLQYSYLENSMDRKALRVQSMGS